MKISRNLLLAGLTLLSLGSTVVAWKSFWRAAQLEAAASGLGDDASVRRQLVESERRRRELEAMVASRAALREGVTGVAGKEQPAAEANEARGRGPRGGREAMQAAMDRPEMQRLAALQQRAALDPRFAPLFKTLSLSLEKLATLKDLLAEKEATMMDTMRAARDQGLDPRSDAEGFKKLMAATQAETDSAIKAAIGETAYAQYEQYQATQPQRNVVSQLQQSLSYTNEPLTTAQAERLVQVIASAAPATGAATVGGPGEGGGGGRGGPPGSGVGGGLGGTGGTAIVTLAAVAQAQAVLSVTQLQALTQIQQLQQAQQHVQALMRASGAGGRGTGGE